VESASKRAADQKVATVKRAKITQDTLKVNRQQDDKVYNCILILSDMHHPFAHPDTVPFLRALKKKYAFDKIVCIGDEADFHNLSYHESIPDLPGAGDELKQAIEGLKPIYELFPSVDVIESNHGSMIIRKGITAGIPSIAIKSYNDILEAPKGWTWQFDLKLRTPLGPVYFCHGKTSAAGRLASQYGMATCQGHFHERAQVHYISTPEKLMYDMHVGCLADDKSLALGYNKINPKRPIVSVGIIINGIPQIIPMVLGKGSRWTGLLP
jgi:hypothetical protein